MSITVMKQALEEYELDQSAENHGKLMLAVCQAIAEAEKQEPVEWGVDWGPDGNSVSIIKRLADGGIEVVGWEYAPHPQQRQWVGLTDEELGDIEETTTCLENESWLRNLTRNIETKLKEKNT